MCSSSIFTRVSNRIPKSKYKAFEHHPYHLHNCVFIYQWLGSHGQCLLACFKSFRFLGVDGYSSVTSKQNKTAFSDNGSLISFSFDIKTFVSRICECEVSANSYKAHFQQNTQAFLLVFIIRYDTFDLCNIGFPFEVPFCTHLCVGDVPCHSISPHPADTTC